MQNKTKNKTKQRNKQTNKQTNKQRSFFRHFQDIAESDDTHDAKINVHSEETPTLFSGSTNMMPMSTPAGQNGVRSSDSGKESDVEIAATVVDDMSDGQDKLERTQV